MGFFLSPAPPLPPHPLTHTHSHPAQPHFDRVPARCDPRPLVLQFTDVPPQMRHSTRASDAASRLRSSSLVLAARGQSTEFPVPSRPPTSPQRGAVHSQASAQMAGNYHQNLSSAAEVRAEAAAEKKPSVRISPSPAVASAAVFGRSSALCSTVLLRGRTRRLPVSHFSIIIFKSSPPLEAGLNRKRGWDGKALNCLLSKSCGGF